MKASTRATTKNHRLVTINLAAFNKAWKLDSLFITHDVSDSKSAGAEKFINGLNGDFSDFLAPEISIYADGSADVTDGRHRLAALISMGVKTIQATMSNDSIKQGCIQGIVY